MLVSISLGVARRGAVIAAMYPPSTGSATPVRLPASSDARNSAAAAQSSGVMIRPSGCDAATMFTTSSELVFALKLVVGIPAGQMAFTRMPSGATSMATPRVSWRTPPLVAP